MLRLPAGRGQASRDAGGTAAAADRAPAIQEGAPA